MQYNKYILQISLIFALMYGILSESFGLGGCRNIQGVDYLNVDKAEGTWYEYARTPKTGHESRCITLSFHLPIAGMWPTTVLQIDKGLFGEKQMGNTHNLTIEGAGKGTTPTGFKYTFLAIDYENYAVVYYCQSYGLAKRDGIVILTRDRFPACDTIRKSYDVVWDFDLSMDSLKKVNQTGCPENWTIDEGVFSFLRG